MIPSGWRETTLGEVCEIRIGGTPSRSISEYWDKSRNGHPWVAISDLKEKWIGSTKETITDAGRDHSNVKLISRGTNIMSFKLTIGRIARAANDLYTNEAIAAFVPLGDDMDPDFLYYALPRAADGVKVDQAVKGATLNKQKLQSAIITLPSFPEQQKIATILGSVDDAIDAAKSVIKQTLKVKQGLLHQLLTKGIGHTKFKKTQIGNIPEDWTVYRADEICERITVGIVINPSSYYKPEGVHCFRSANVREGYIEDSNWVYISPEDNEILSKSKLQTGDVLVVRTGYPGTSCVVPQSFDGANCIDTIIARPNRDFILPEYLSLFINSSAGKKQILHEQGGLAQKHFNVGSLNRMQVALPSLKEQRTLTMRAQFVDESLRNNEQFLAELQELKRGLMQDLLTGRVRVA